VTHGFSTEKGLSLVELLISTVIGMIVIAAGGKLYVDSRFNSRIQDDLSGMQQNARVALDALSRDIRRAGYLSGNIDRRSIGGTGLRVPDGSCPTASGRWGAMLFRPIFGLDDTNAGYACIPANDYLRGDILTLRYADSRPVSTMPSSGELFIRSSLTQGAVFQGEDEANPGNAVAGSPVFLRRLVSHAYYIRPSGVITCPDGSRPPSLYREQLDRNGLPIAEELATGIEQLQVMFGIDANSDGSAMRFIDANAMSSSDWDRVRQVRLWVLARQECGYGGYRSPQTRYSMGSMTYQVPAAERGLRRMLFSKAVNVRNG
jgi:type IV pilus assembly protein PilW